MGEQQNQRQSLLQAVAGQQKTIDSLVQKIALQDVVIDYIADLAGLKGHVAGIRRKADLDNPAQPVPNPPSEPASESTQEAATPEAYDDPRNPGMTPGSVQDVPADTTTVALQPGEALPTAPFTDLQDVQAPVAGTETHVPNEQTRIETDVRVSPNASPTANPQVAFPWNDAMGPNLSNTGSRQIASIRLARLQIEAGMAEGETDDLSLGARIAASDTADDEINRTIQILEETRKAAARKEASRKERPAGMVPRSASTSRTVPSMFNGTPVTASAISSIDASTQDSDLFD